MVFDTHWIQEAMPKVTHTRIAVVAAGVAVIALALGGWLLYRGQNRDEIRARTYSDGFLSAQSAAVRMSNLAGLFRLGDPFADSARDLFFGLDADDQLLMFTGLNDPEQVGDDLQTVIRGLYTHLENSDQHNALLSAMAADLDQIKEVFPDSRILCGEINAWLRGRSHFQNGGYEEAIASYEQAVDYNGQNPATRLDCALAHTRLDQHEAALTELSDVLKLDPGRQEQVGDLVQSTPALRDYLVQHRDDFPTLAEYVK
jgi:tetratricopeptide (TPR) repeat protein